MHSLTDKEYASFKAICKQAGITYATEAEYEEAAQSLYDYAKLAYGLAREYSSWEQRLKNEPEGFWLDSEGRTCYVCSTNIHGQIWFDKWGLKCANCQSAFRQKVFPGYILKDKYGTSYITDSQLSWKYGLRSQTIKMLVEQKKLKPRVIPNGPQLFLKRENEGLQHVIEEHRQGK